MDTYTDIKVLECNRLHSEESRANNDENYAHWTNNLQDIFHLEAGDQVSVHGAMVSERGAGQSSSIEIKGESLGITNTYQYINLSGSVISATEARRISGGYDLLTAELTTETKELFDNKGNFLEGKEFFTKNKAQARKMYKATVEFFVTDLDGNILYFDSNNNVVFICKVC